MKKHLLSFTALLFLSQASFSQNKSPGKTISTPIETLLTPLKPLDASPVVFTSAAELEAKKQNKISATRDLIRQNKDNAALVVQYREQLWRLENAIVAEPKKTNPFN